MSIACIPPVLTMAGLLHPCPFYELQNLPLSLQHQTSSSASTDSSAPVCCSDDPDSCPLLAYHQPRLWLVCCWGTQTEPWALYWSSTVASRRCRSSWCALILLVHRWQGWWAVTRANRCYVQGFDIRRSAAPRKKKSRTAEKYRMTKKNPEKK